MTETILTKIALILAGVFAYGVLRWRLMCITHEFRTDVGCEVDRWVANPQIDQSIRSSLAFLADLAYRPAVPWIILLELTVAMLLPLRKPHDARLSDNVGSVAELVKLKLKLVLALITTSPLASILAMLVVVVGLLVRSSVNTIKERISEVGDSNRFFPRRLAGHP